MKLHPQVAPDLRFEVVAQSSDQVIPMPEGSRFRTLDDVVFETLTSPTYLRPHRDPETGKPIDVYTLVLGNQKAVTVRVTESDSHDPSPEGDISAVTFRDAHYRYPEVGKLALLFPRGWSSIDNRPKTLTIAEDYPSHKPTRQVFPVGLHDDLFRVAATDAIGRFMAFDPEQRPQATDALAQ